MDTSTAKTPNQIADQNTQNTSAAGYDALAKASAVTKIPYTNSGGQVIAGMMPASGTVLSNYTYANETKPALDATLSKITASRGTTMDANGTQVHSDGNVYTPPPPPIPAGYQGQLDNGKVPEGTTQGGLGYTLSDPDAQGMQHYYQFSPDPQIENLNQQLIAKSDTRTRRDIEVINQQKQVLDSQLAASNKSSEAGLKQSLLMGGSSRYAQLSSDSTLQVKRDYGIQQIAELDAKEQALINQAQDAGDGRDQTVYQNAIAGLEKVRQEKQAAAQKVVDAQAAEIKKNKETQVQSQQDEAVAKALTLNPNAKPEELLQTLNTGPDGKPNGNNFTSKQIADTLKNISPNGDLTKLTGGLGEYYKLVQDGVPLPAEITALPKEQQPFAYVQYAHNLTVKATAAKTSKPVAQKPDPNYKMQLQTWNELTETGLKPIEIGSIEHDIQVYGLNAVLTNPNTQLTEDQKTHIRSEYVKTRNPTTMLPAKTTASSNDPLAF